MKKLTLITAMILVASCAACSPKAESPTTVIATTAEPATASTEENTAEEPTTTANKTAEHISTDSLENFLAAYPDSQAYHLFFDIMQNDESKSNQNPGVTYMFSKDGDGNRTAEAITAYYSDTDLSGTDVETFCSDFISKYFPELSSPFENAETATEPKYMQAAIFKDYTIVLMPDKDNAGMTVMISKTKGTSNTIDSTTDSSTISDLENYLLDNNALTGNRTEMAASMVGAISGFKYSDPKVEIYEYDINSSEYKALNNGEEISLQGMENVKIKATSINGKYVLFGNVPQTVIDVFDSYK